MVLYEMRRLLIFWLWIIALGAVSLLGISRLLQLTCNHMAQLMLEVILSKCKRASSPMSSCLSTLITATTLVAIFTTQRSRGSQIEVIIHCGDNTCDVVHISAFTHL